MERCTRGTRDGPIAPYQLQVVAVDLTIGNVGTADLKNLTTSNPTWKSDSGSTRSASFSKKMETMMRFPLLAVRVAVACGIGCSPAYAATYQWPYDGQAPLPPSLSDQTAQPECGFAATESWGPNGFQWCDPKNVYPGPRAARSYPRR